MNALSHIFASISKPFNRVPTDDWRRLWDACRKIVADVITPGVAAPSPQPQPQPTTGDLFSE